MSSSTWRSWRNCAPATKGRPSASIALSRRINLIRSTLAKQVTFSTPDGAAGQKPYSLIKQVMEDQRLHCIARIVLHNKEQLVVIRVVDGVLCMTGLKYATQVKRTELFSDMIHDESSSKQELKLAEKLILDSTRESFDLADYGDTYTERLHQLIQAKIEGKEVVATPSTDSPPVINLMDALKASVEQAKSQGMSPLKSGSRRSGSPSKPKASAAKKKPTSKESTATESLKEKLASTKKTPRTGGKKKTG